MGYWGYRDNIMTAEFKDLGQVTKYLQKQCPGCCNRCIQDTAVVGTLSEEGFRMIEGIELVFKVRIHQECEA